MIVVGRKPGFREAFNIVRSNIKALVMSYVFFMLAPLSLNLIPVDWLGDPQTYILAVISLIGGLAILGLLNIMSSLHKPIIGLGNNSFKRSEPMELNPNK